MPSGAPPIEEQGHGSAVLGLIFDMFGWPACVGGIAAALLVAALLAVFLRTPMTPEALRH